jgi:hypothetical protein
MPNRHALALLGLALALGVLQAPAAAETALAAATAPADAEAPALTGKDIYSRVLENRFRSFEQKASLESGDRSGRVQKTRVKLSFMDFRDAESQAERGVLSKTIIRYTHPFDLRHAGYLVIQNEDRPNDQFVYLPAQRRTTRVNLRGEAIFGTDFSFEDIIPGELENASYTRREDESLQEKRVYVVEAVPLPEYASEYSKFLFYVDDEHFIPLRTRYWDQSGVEIKEMRASRDDIHRFGDVSVPMKLTMRHLLLESQTTLQIEELDPEAAIPASTFEVRRLESH